MDSPSTAWKQTITRAPIDGLYEVSVQVEHTRSGKPVYELRTMLFEPPSDSSTEKDRKSSSRSNEKGGRAWRKSRIAARLIR